MLGREGGREWRGEGGREGGRGGRREEGETSFFFVTFCLGTKVL